jgi:hypothetical protein
MPTLEQAIKKALAAAAAATQAEAASSEPTLTDDPWHFLDLEHGAARLRDYLARRDPVRQRGHESG